MATTASDAGGFCVLDAAGGSQNPRRRQPRSRPLDATIRPAIAPIDGDAVVPGPPRVWSDVRLANIGLLRSFDLAPDGKRIVALLPAESTSSDRNNQVTFVQHFIDEVERRLSPR